MADLVKKKLKRNYDTQLVELAGKGWVISQLIQGGIEVARPERDHGVDLIAYVERPKFVARRIQLKVASGSAFVVHRTKYRGMLLVYVWHLGDSSQTKAYAMTSAQACRIARKMGWTGKCSWKNGYWRVPHVGAGGKLYKLLENYQMTPSKWKATISKTICH